MRDDESKDTLASQLPTIIFIHLSLLKLRHLEELEICTIHLVSMADTSLFFTDPLSPPHAFQQFLHVAHRGTHTHTKTCAGKAHTLLNHRPCLLLGGFIIFNIFHASHYFCCMACHCCVCVSLHVILCFVEPASALSWALRLSLTFPRSSD